MDLGLGSLGVTVNLLCLDAGTHRLHLGVEEKEGECICPLSWSVHHNFARDGRLSERGRACSPTLTRLG